MSISILNILLVGINSYAWFSDNLQTEIVCGIWLLLFMHMKANHII